jgi:tRNA(fMet)-specific endonuclease VapC
MKNIRSVQDKISQIGWEKIYICNITTVAELYFGAYNSHRVAENLIRVQEFIQNIEVIYLDDRAGQKFGELKASLRKMGQPVADFD